MGAEMIRRILFVIVIILQCNFSWAARPLPKEIKEAIEMEKEMKREVIERKMEEEPKEVVVKKPVPVEKDVPKDPPMGVIITALVVLLIAFSIWKIR